MPKKPLSECIVHQFLLHASDIAEAQRVLSPDTYEIWQKWIKTLSFSFKKEDQITISWSKPIPGLIVLSSNKYNWYVRGDTDSSENTLWKKDKKMILKANAYQSQKLVRLAAKQANLPVHRENSEAAVLDGLFHKNFFEEERLFDAWARSCEIRKIDVIKMNESVTAPEMRYIIRTLGNIEGKKILDLGCGLGEASVYFARRGAMVTAIDLSTDMVSATKRLAQKYHLKLETLQSNVEHLQFKEMRKFDIVYAGNLFHHIDINLALARIVKMMHPKSVLVCWEPVDHNPLLAIYRHFVTKVRSFDEHPLRVCDIKIFQKYFSSVETHWFWLTTLIIFPIMIFFQRRNPNKERLWKSIVREGDKWAWIYQPLAFLDKILLTIFPFLKPLCWNVVIICRNRKYINT